MSHPEQLSFIKAVKERWPNYFVHKKVLEVGSREINGSVRPFFLDCTYVGIDAEEGDGVDVVTLAHEYEDTPFDTVISCELLEHDPYAEKTCAKMLELLKPGGLLIITCATTGRPEHGVDTYSVESHYRNISAKDLMDWLRPEKRFSYWSVIQRQTEPCDLYFWGVSRANQAG